jgi:hypothetical protein
MEESVRRWDYSKLHRKIYALDFVQLFIIFTNVFKHNSVELTESLLGSFHVNFPTSNVSVYTGILQYSICIRPIAS